MQDIHVDIVVPAFRNGTFYHAFREHMEEVEGLHRNVSGDQKFNVSLAEACEVPVKTVKANHNPFIVRILLQKCIYQVYSGIGHGDMLYVRVGIEEFFKFFQCLLRAFRVNEYRMYSAFWKIFFNLVDEPMTSGGIGIRLVS